MSKVEDKIIEATINSIEKFGINKTTIRQIAKEAGLNSSSINYYFRSKDILMQRVMVIVLKNAFDLSNFDNSRNLPIKERLIVIMDGMLYGALQYSNTTKSIYSEIFNSDHYNLPAIQSCNEFLCELEVELKEAFPEISQLDIRMILMHISSSTFLFLGLFPGFFSLFSEIDISDAKIRRDYIEKLVNKLL